MRKRIAVTFDPDEGLRGGYLVDLPTYSMVKASWLPLNAIIHADGPLGADDQGVPVKPADVLAFKPTVACDLPDDWPLDSRGQIDAPRFRAMYAGTRFGSDDYMPPVLSAP